MSHQYIAADLVDINICPALDVANQAMGGVQITVGDLHGNAQKLLYILKRHGFIDITAEDYAAFFNIYRKNRLEKRDLQRFNDILNRIEVQPAARQSFLRLIGDVLADRGMNDYFTLKILKKLRDQQIPFEMLIANHDAEFIASYEKKLGFNSSKLGSQQAQSAYNLQELLTRKLITPEELHELVESTVKLALVTLSYSLNETQDKITVYSHGVIGLNNMRHIAQALGVHYADDSAIVLAQTIEAINARFVEHVKNNTITDLLKLDQIDIEAINGLKPIDEEKFPFAHLIWNRKPDGLERPQHIYFVHGHDIHDKTMNNIFNLDNILGKTLSMHQGTYTALYSRENSLCSVLTLPTATEPDLQTVLSELEKEWVKVDAATPTESSRASSSSAFYWQPLRMLSDWWYKPTATGAQQQSIAGSSVPGSLTTNEKVTIPKAVF